MVKAASALQWRDLWALYCPEFSPSELSKCEWLTQSPLWPQENDTPVTVCDWLGRLYSIHASTDYRKNHGQFFTPPAVAHFMAGLCAPLQEGSLTVEPAAGAGILVAALAERLAKERTCRRWRVAAYEIDPALRPALCLGLGYTRHWLRERSIPLRFEIIPDDFIIANAVRLRPAPLLEIADAEKAPGLVIANPPYFKIPRSDPRVELLSEVVHGQPNIYALFMAAAAKALAPEGQMVFITPRSFCSGPYFRQFRKWFFQTISPERVHLFTSRTDTFGQDDVLQENVILAGRKTSGRAEFVTVSSSNGAADLAENNVRLVPLHDVLDLDSPDAVFNIPTDPVDDTIRRAFGHWKDRLSSFGLNISTGPIVPFRTGALMNAGNEAASAPVLWMQHIGRMAVTWPLLRFHKPQHIRVQTDTYSLLVPNENFVLIRRFSAKEENCRITAAPYIKGSLPFEYLGIENHLNYLHRPGGTLSQNEAYGLAAILNSRWVDQYFRQLSGNTQINAAELRNLPLPPLDKVNRIGERIQHTGGVSRIALINQIVGEELGLPLDLQNGHGGHMPKIEEAKDLLRAIGLPSAQRNELAALTLLALANLMETAPWQDAQRRSIRIHDMILFVEQNYHRRYAENTRETFRRQVLHQFEQARIVDRNPDDPSLPTNSPRTHYAISEAALPVIQGYGTKAGQRALENFIGKQGTLLELYQQRRSQKMIPLKDLSGQEIRLSPGRHNQLQVAVIEQFAPRFALGARLLYIGDTANISLLVDVKGLERVGFPVNKHGKLPDIVLYSPKKKWLYLIEVVTSHGPMSPKRYHELEAILAKSPAGRIYVSVFPDLKEFIRHARDIAWEPEIWISDAPDHMIHYNGEKFVGPLRPKKPKAKSN